MAVLLSLALVLNYHHHSKGILLILYNFSYIIPKISNTLEDNQEYSLNQLNTLKHTYFGDGIPLFTEDRISLPDNYISKNRDKQVWENIKDKRCCRSTYSTTGSCVCDFKEKNYSLGPNKSKIEVNCFG